MKLKLAHVIVAMATMVAASSQAADWYVGGSLGASNYHIDMSGTTSSDKTDTGYKLFAGAKLTPNLAIEGGYADLGKAKATVPVNGTIVNLSLKGTGLFADLVGIVPMSPEISLFGKLGVSNSKLKLSGSAGTSSFSDSDTTNQIHYGFGGQYDISKMVGIRAEWERFRGRYNKNGLDTGSGDVDLVSIGAVVRF